MTRPPATAAAAKARVMGLHVALLEAEVDLMRRLVVEGILPPDARREPTAPELRAGVRFAALERIVDDAAGVIARRALTVRNHVLDGLAEQLAPLIDQADPYAALEVLDRLTDPTRGDTIPGLRKLVDATAGAIRGDLITVAQQGAAEALDEARRQGVPDSLIGDVVLGDTVEAAATTHAQRVATAPATRLLDVAAQGGSRAAMEAGAAGGQVLDGALTAAETATMTGVEDTARQAANVTHGLGRAAAQRALPDPREVYASELLDRNTCRPCATVDGRLYDSLASGLVDYPGAGGYIGCDGGARCRGTLVLVHKTEAPPTVQGPGSGGEPIDRTPQGPSNPGRPGHIDDRGQLIPRPIDKGTAPPSTLGDELDSVGRTVMPPDVEAPVETVAPGQVERDPELAEYNGDELERLLEDDTAPMDRRLAAADELDQRNAGTRTQVYREENLDAATLARYEDDRAAWEEAGGDVVASFTGDLAAERAGGRRIERVRAAWTEQVEQEHLRAEDATNGYLIRKDRLAEFDSKYGHQQGSTVVLFEGPARVAYYYASPELREYWRDHERKSFAEFAVENGVGDAKTRKRARAAVEARQEAILNSETSEEAKKRRRQRAQARRRPMTEGDRLAQAQRRRDRLRDAERRRQLEMDRLTRDEGTP